MELAILWKAFLAGFGIGILGSLHCVGMCGPLALSLPVVQVRGMRFAGIKILLYNAGRVMSYTAIGLGMGIIGFSFALYNLQRWLSIGSGLIILGIAVMQFRQVRHIVLLEDLYEGVSRKISGLLSGKESPGKYLSLGIQWIFALWAGLCGSGDGFVNGQVLLFGSGDDGLWGRYGATDVGTDVFRQEVACGCGADISAECAVCFACIGIVVDHAGDEPGDTFHQP